MKKIINKHPLAIRWFHWINFPILTIMPYFTVWHFCLYKYLIKKSLS